MRPATAADEDFLRDVYGSTRTEELDRTPWDAGQRAAFVAMQYAAQLTHYRSAYPDASVDVIVVDGEDAGRLYVARLPADLRIVDVTLLPAFRGRGVGSRLLGELLAEAAATGRVAIIHVERENPARRLYDRLGFVPVEEDIGGVYTRMEWRAPAHHPPKIMSNGELF